MAVKRRSRSVVISDSTTLTVTTETVERHSLNSLLEQVLYGTKAVQAPERSTERVLTISN